MIRAFSLALLASLMLSGTALAAPQVVASIKPIHALVAAVMEEVGEPILIVKGSASPHTYALKPSDASALEAADIVFWTGPDMELFLGDALGTLAPHANSVELAETPGIHLLSPRESGAFEPHDHGEAGDHDHDEQEHDHDHDHEAAGHDHADHHHAEETDPHFFLDPENARLMVTHIAEVLAEADPENAAIYETNADAERVALDELEAEIRDSLAPVKDKPFIVFHDAYQYFEQRFGLDVAGSITLSPEAMPGAARIDELHAKVGELGATCVFAEPNFRPAIVDTIIEGTAAKAGILDPEGSTLAEGPDLYAQLLRGLATNLVDCLK